MYLHIGNGTRRSAHAIRFQSFAMICRNVRLEVSPILYSVFQRRALVLQGVDEPV